ncbi:site-specific DNA-methyltransferase (Adenine-specific) [Clostridium sp. CAG:768]|nr:site-specific DNA-methyltransferase (Adenine-specific) [Clostridium sp. CAG:768]
MSEKLNDLKKKLKEIFQLDQTDLDFGIYRIMNEKSSEITDFLDNKLLPQVKESFSDLANEDKASIQKELNEAIEQAKSLGANPDDLPKVKELKAQLSSSVDLTVLENDVYSHLTNFFSRYYEGGDFMSLRRYKKDVYAIPYEGEEVKLYWANSDQYYIKTSENFKDYTFTIGNDESKQTVHFKLIEAETEKDNNKADKERRFILIDENPIEIIDGELYIKFQYTIDENNKNQKSHNEETIAKLLPELSKSEYADYINLLDKKPTEKNKDRTLLEKHLTDYTAKNSFDYFIHKDLGGFLNRELDFYIKNEVLNLDDLDENNIKKSLNKAKAIKKIAQKIITLLAQLEEFQKKLWLKKKMVVETNYCLTLDKVDERFYPEIISNEAQIQEWEELFKISEITADLTKLGGDTLLNGTDNDKKIEFLKQNPYLVLDTKFFSQDFKYDLISTIENLDEQTNGLLINADNFHALNLLQEKYTEQVKCIYIDPPYNSPSSEIIYKNCYKHSSWLTLMENRINISKCLNTIDGSLITAIDKYEENGLQRLLKQTFASRDIVSVAIEHNKKGTQGDHFSFSNEFAIFAISASLKKLNEKIISKENWEYSNLRNWGGESERKDAANCFYPIYVQNNKIIGYGDIIDNDIHPQNNEIIKNKNILMYNDLKNPLNGKKSEYFATEKDPIIAIYPIDQQGIERKWRYEVKTLHNIFKNLRIKTEKGNSITIEMPKCTEQFKSLWSSSIYNAGDNGTKVLRNMGITEFDFPKSIFTVKDCVFATSNKCDIILDYFAGSGTTGHAVIELNREDNGNRKYILVEMGKYFNTVTKPRIQKVIYSKEWKDGKPVNRDGISQIFKYISLESYEDALNNLHKKGTQVALGQNVEEQYKLSYMMDFEYSDSIFNLEMFKNPFDYKMNITIGNETKLVNVDLIETFNYLIGLKVSSMYKKDGFIVIEGTNLKEENILVIWRNIEEKSNEDLDVFLKRRKINPCDFEFNKIYVNGDNNLQNLKTDEENFKVMLIEEEFKNRMFDVKEV